MHGSFGDQLKPSVIEGTFRSGTMQTAESTIKGTLQCSPVVACLIAVNVAVFYALPVAFKSYFPYRRESLGALWGPLVFDGQWWRVLTYLFVHFDVDHLFVNMLGLWIFGTRLERDLGKRIFLLFYLACGLIVALVSLALRPDEVFIGASGAIVGIVGGLIVIYGARVRELSWSARSKLALLILYAIGLTWHEFSLGQRILPHTTGMLAGGLLAFLVVYVARTPRAKRLIFVGLVLLFAVAATLIQRHYR